MGKEEEDSVDDREEGGADSSQQRGDVPDVAAAYDEAVEDRQKTDDTGRHGWEEDAVGLEDPAATCEPHECGE